MTRSELGEHTVPNVPASSQALLKPKSSCGAILAPDALSSVYHSSLALSCVAPTRVLVSGVPHYKDLTLCHVGAPDLFEQLRYYLVPDLKVEHQLVRLTQVTQPGLTVPQVQECDRL
jgi:hypothetical protein